MANTDDTLPQAPDQVTGVSSPASSEAFPPRDAAGPASARVHLQARNTVLAFADGGSVTLPVGVGDLARDVLRHDPPTPAELERGIELVEDALMAARLPQADRGTLLTGDSAVRMLPGLELPQALLPLAAFEALFQRLASRALGTPVPASELPEGSEIAAALLVLRECMHHLGFDSIGVAPLGDSGASPGSRSIRP